MCNRYRISKDHSRGLLPRLSDEVSRAARELPNTDNIVPGETGIVVAFGRGGRAKAVPMQWGIEMGRDLVYNAKFENVANPYWEDARRCVVVMTRFYETHKKTGLVWDCFQLKPIIGNQFSVAGVYKLVDGKPRFAVVTLPAEDPIKPIHDRQPWGFGEWPECALYLGEARKATDKTSFRFGVECRSDPQGSFRGIGNSC